MWSLLFEKFIRAWIPYHKMYEWIKKRHGCFKLSDLEWNVYMPEDALLLPWNTQWQTPNWSVLNLINFHNPVSENQEYRKSSRSQVRSSFQSSVSLAVFYIPLPSFPHLHVSLTPNSLYIIPTGNLCTRSQGRLSQGLYMSSKFPLSLLRDLQSSWEAGEAGTCAKLACSHGWALVVEL